MYKRFISVSILLILLSSCSSSPWETIPTNSWSTGAIKTPFEAKVLTVKNASEVSFVEKTGRITASSTLTLTSQGAGEIGKILVKEWQRVNAGTTIAVLKDTVNNFDIRLAQAENALSVQDTSIATTKINLDQSVQNAKIAYERAQQSYETLTSKNAIAYATTVNTNAKTLDSYNENYKTYLADLDRIMTQSLYDGDKIIGASSTFEYANDAWEDYLGARVGNSRSLAEEAWGKAYATRGSLRAKKEKNTSLDTKNLQADLDTITDGYRVAQLYGDAMIYMLQNNVIGAGLSQPMQDGWVATWNANKSQIQAGEAQYNAWKSQTQNFFRNYKNTETATELALASLTRELTPAELAIINGSNDLKVTYESTRIDFKDKVESAKLNMSQAKTAYDTAMNLRDATIAQLEASRKSTSLSLDQARRDYAKLSVSAPVEGVVTRVIASVWQSINAGAPIIEFAGKQPQIVLDIDPGISSGLSVGDSLAVQVEGKTLSGIVSAVSAVSNSNLLSTVRINVLGADKYIGKNVSITFLTRGNKAQEKIILPIDSVNIIAEGEWEINILAQSGTIEKKTVRLGRAESSNIEILDTLNPTDTIILTNLSNFDASKNTLVIIK